ncbi:MAG: SDR family oxidoreductase [Calditrichaeota bacterium]|nr:MAG: SDR family oxidoreductase [Calditrichota bacterium]
MDLGLKGRSAVVMAASKGLGKAAARALAAEGCRVAISARHAETLTAAAREIEQQYGVEVVPVAGDVRNPRDIQTLIDSAAREFGGVDILVTNAGGPPVRTFEDSTDEEWREWYDITFLSVVRSVRAALPHLKKSGRGRIINITSSSVKAPIESLVYSNALRLAVVGLAKTLSRELGPHGITVHNVAPGYHLTDGLERIIVNKMQQGLRREQVLESWSRSIPVGRIGRPEDLGALIAWLAGDQASYLNGTTIPVDGGLYPGVM